MAASKSREEATALRDLDDLAAEDRRRRFLETTIEERIETALQLSELAAELRAGLVREVNDPAPLAQRILIRQLAEGEVEFVLVGGFAVAAHGYPMATEGVDIVFSTERRSCEHLAAVLGDLGAVVRFADVPGPGEGIGGAWLSVGGHLRFATEAGPLDALSSVVGLDYETLASRAARSRVGGSDVLVCSYDDLVTMKSAGGRDRDRLNLAELRRVRGEGA